MHGCFRCQKRCDCAAGDEDVTACLHCDDPDEAESHEFDEPEDPDNERCPECGAWPEEYHEMDCSRGYDDENDECEDDPDEDVEDFS